MQQYDELRRPCGESIDPMCKFEVRNDEEGEANNLMEGQRRKQLLARFDRNIARRFLEEFHQVLDQWRPR